MDSERQQPPLPGKKPPIQGQQPGHQGWQYDQELAKQGPGQGQVPPSPAQIPPYPPSQQAAGQPLPPQSVRGNVPPYSPRPAPGYPPSSAGGANSSTGNVPDHYQQPIADMGTSLGYGTGMEYQYFDVPQPSQPMPRLRMERLQQLRQDRIRRDPQNKRADFTSLIRRRREGKGSTPPGPRPSGQGPSLVPPSPTSVPPVGSGVLLPPVGSGVAYPPAGAGSSPSLPGKSAVPVSSGPDPAIAAIEPAQNTAAIQKVRMGRATLILSGSFIVSRVLGLLRQAMFSGIFGTGPVSDAYVQAFVVPDTIFQIVAGGALASAFIPIFTKYMVSEDDEYTAWHIANTALTLCTTIMVVLSVLAMIFAGPIVNAYSPINPNDPNSPFTHNLITELMRIMLLQAILLGSGVIINSVLQARQNFLLPAIGTVIYNVGIIVGLVPGLIMGATGHLDRNIPASYVAAAQWASWGVVVGALLQVAVQVAGLKNVGMRVRPSFDWRNIAVLQIGKQMLPRVFNASVLSLTTVVDRYLITVLSGVVTAAVIAQKAPENPANGLITQYYNAYQLVMLPLGIIGMAMSTAAFPTLAEYVSRGRMERVRTILLETLRSILFLSIPASIALIILGLPVIQAMLQHGAFGLDSANATAVCLGFFSIGLVGMSAVEICTRAFYALRDSRTPVIVSICQFLVKIALGLILINLFVSIGTSLAKGDAVHVALNGAIWGMGSLGLATALSSLGEATVIFILLHQRIGGLIQRSLFTFMARTLLATAALGVTLLAARLILDALINTTNPDAPRYLVGNGLPLILLIVKLVLELFAGLFVYLRAAKMLKLEELGPFRRLLDRFKLSWLM
jgi:putative peptidoglycan lipid II flippase